MFDKDILQEAKTIAMEVIGQRVIELGLSPDESWGRDLYANASASVSGYIALLNTREKELALQKLNMLKTADLEDLSALTPEIQLAITEAYNKHYPHWDKIDKESKETMDATAFGSAYELFLDMQASLKRAGARAALEVLNNKNVVVER